MHDRTEFQVDLADGTTLHVRSAGSGVPLLLLHGLTGTGADFSHLFDLDALASTYRWLAPDARGHGTSTSPAEPFSFARCARDALAMLDALGVDKACAVGVSLGANTLLHLATLAPSRLQRMILVSAAPRFPETTRATFRAFAAAPRSSEEWALLRAQHVGGDAQIEALLRLPTQMADDPFDMAFTPQALQTVRARTLVVAGDRDPLYPVELALELYRGIPESSLWVVPGGGHCPIFGAFREAFEGAARTFLSDDGASAASS